MKYIVALVASLSALASALPQPISERGYCSPISYGTCVPGDYKIGAYHFDEHCGQIFDLKRSNYKVMSNHPGLSYEKCVYGCSTGPSKCCAVNYNKCTGLCQYLQRDDNTDECFKTPVFYTVDKDYDSATCVPPFKPNDG